MKIIHCADLHLDSVLTANLSPDKARERRAELLTTFDRMITYAEKNSVDAVIIAGDLFDRKNVSAKAANTVYGAVTGHPGIDFYYLRGNHDADGFISGFEELPPNLKLFGDEWTSYSKGRVTITGAEMTGGHKRLCPTLSIDPDRFNIVILHGQEAADRSSDKPENIDLRELRGRGIDYLALGHVHAFKLAELDSRGSYCYPGCLEGRGFDECGDHGFMLLNIDENRGTYSADFVPFARRRLWEIRADISGCMSTPQIMDRSRPHISDCKPEDLVKLVLTGQIDADCEKDPGQIEKNLEDEFFFIRVSDETVPVVNYGDYATDISLKGEFVRTVQARTDLSEEDKAAIIRYGIQALEGKEVS